MSTAMHMFQPSETCTHGLFLGISTGCPACWQNCCSQDLSQDWWLTSWKQFGNANLEKIAHPGKTPKKKKLKYPLIHCESLSGLQSTKDRIGWSDHTVSYEHGAADHTQPEHLKRMWYKTSWPPNLCNHIWQNTIWVRASKIMRIIS